MKHSEHPSFALVGHPNKGKSSIVSTLAYDDSVAISSRPGETTQTRAFPLMIDGKTEYKLFDTPGFQSPRRVLQWLKQHETTSRQHAQTLKQFVTENAENERFKDEIELLRPILEGACIVYVVDGSKPYSEEYESEMEILRWSGRPSIALINTIDKTDHTAEWKAALDQHFKMVRMFDPMVVTFQKKIELLEALSHLDERWTQTLKASIETLKRHHQQLIADTAMLITENIYRSITYEKHSSPFDKTIDDAAKERLSALYVEALIQYETDTQKEIERLWGHRRLTTHSQKKDFHDVELFSEESRRLFGLSRSSLAVVGAAVGATAGGGLGLIAIPIDGGATAFLGASLGAVAGAASGLFGYGRYLNIITLGGLFEDKRLQIGPMKDENFPFILLSRSVHHAIIIANRSHAKRESVDLQEHSSERLFDTETKKRLARLHQDFRKGKDIEKAKEVYRAALVSIMQEKII